MSAKTIPNRFVKANPEQVTQRLQAVTIIACVLLGALFGLGAMIAIS